MWQRLVVNHDLVVAKESVRHALRILDPEGVDERLRHRLQRRQYKRRGPNFLRHIEGFDKLKPYGFCIHGGIDGYSRRILWLEAGISNNEPAFIAKYFVDCVKAAGGTARIVERLDTCFLFVKPLLARIHLNCLELRFSSCISRRHERISFCSYPRLK
ncbi:hypothetical protein P5673_028901 [Acropora cervicornis]|uniref:Integrase core domain-containing protein n=1 Tax=Acropora cervicornis TaxID=6130 RepID=A0AAD9PWK4_ACRCE|nr:hypothetical protein P5673_028901 [Acropora cervicornis]